MSTRYGSKKGGWHSQPEEKPAASHTGYPESGDLLPLFFFPKPPLGLMRPR